MKKGVCTIYRMIKRMLDFLVLITVFEHFKTVAVLGLCVMLMGAYNQGIVRSWYRSMHIHCTLLNVKLGDGLTISVLRNSQTHYKSLEFEIDCF
jgi:hypothetical protein